MGDVRFLVEYDRVKQSADPLATIRELSEDDVIAALAGASMKKDPYLANVLATEAMNRLLRVTAITESLGEGVVVAGPDGRVEAMNPAACAALGWTEADARGRRLHEIFHPEEDEEDEKDCPLSEGHAPESRVERESLFSRRGGGAVPVSYTQTPLLRHGALRGRVVVFRDITERRRQERVLEGQRKTLETVVERALEESAARRRAETRFRGFIEAAPDALLIVDGLGRIVLANSQVERVFGFSRDELVGRRIERLLPSRFRELHARHREGYSHAPVARPMGTGLELYALRADGSEFPVEISLSPVETEEGVLVMCSIRDVTGRVETQDRLRRGVERLEQAAAMTGLGSWEWDIGKDTVEWSEELYRIMGVAPGEGGLTYDSTIARVHPADRPRIEANVAQSVSDGTPFETVLRIVRPSGEARTILARAAPFRDAEGRILRLVGTVQDVTDRERVAGRPRIANVDLSAAAAETLHRLAEDSPERRVAVDVERGVVAWSDPVLLRFALDRILEGAWAATALRRNAWIRVATEGGVPNGFVVEDNAEAPHPASGEDPLVERLLAALGGSLRATFEEGAGNRLEVALPAAEPRLRARGGEGP